MGFKSAGRRVTVLPGGKLGNVKLEGMGVFFLRCPLAQTWLALVTFKRFESRHMSGMAQHASFVAPGQAHKASRTDPRENGLRR